MMNHLARSDRLSHLRWLSPLLLLLATSSGMAATVDPVAQVQTLPQASLLLQEQGRDVIAYHADELRIPASTMKLLTAFAALETWGRDYRFQTDILRDDAGWLWVKGYADPYLVSEELDRIVSALKSQGLTSVSGIGLDDGFFAPDVEIAGRSSSDNPYDAPVTALAANFNTLNLVRNGDQIRSAESQTQLTPTGRRFGLAGAAGVQRVNLKERKTAVTYFGELLAAKLGDAGIRVSGQLKLGPTPRSAKLFYRHTNNRTLAEMIRPMLKFSSNFIANALFLRLAEPTGSRPVSMVAARRKMTEFAHRRFGWTDVTIEDGAGLSRGNRVSARQLVAILDAFVPYRDLLPEQEGNQAVRAKTGTLTGVNCYAGYVRRNGVWAPFALMINQPVDHDLRQRVATKLVR